MRIYPALLSNGGLGPGANNQYPLINERHLPMFPSRQPDTEGTARQLQGQRPWWGPGATPLVGSRGNAPGGVQGQRPWSYGLTVNIWPWPRP